MALVVALSARGASAQSAGGTPGQVLSHGSVIVRELPAPTPADFANEGDPNPIPAVGSPAYGTAFKLREDGSHYSVIHAFQGTIDPHPYNWDGAGPVAPLTEGADGLLYGAAEYGGGYNNGLLFAMATDGAGYNKLYSFGAGGASDGAKPTTGLLQPSAGNSSHNLFGQTYAGGADGLGTVYTIPTAGVTATTLHSFTGYDASDIGLSDGANPYFATLIQGLDGLLYGATSSGGGSNAGAAFSISLATPYPLTNLYWFTYR